MSIIKNASHIWRRHTPQKCVCHACIHVPLTYISLKLLQAIKFCQHFLSRRDFYSFAYTLCVSSSLKAKNVCVSVCVRVCVCVCVRACVHARGWVGGGDKYPDRLIVFLILLCTTYDHAPVNVRPICSRDSSSCHYHRARLPMQWSLPLAE